MSHLDPCSSSGDVDLELLSEARRPGLLKPSPLESGAGMTDDPTVLVVPLGASYEQKWAPSVSYRSKRENQGKWEEKEVRSRDRDGDVLGSVVRIAVRGEKHENWK